MSEQTNQSGLDLPITPDRLMSLYAQGLRRYLAAEEALVSAPEPIEPALVYEHHLASEDFRVVRGILAASITHSEALHAIEGWQ